MYKSAFSNAEDGSKDPSDKKFESSPTGSSMDINNTPNSAIKQADHIVVESFVYMSKESSNGTTIVVHCTNTAAFIADTCWIPVTCSVDPANK